MATAWRDKWSLISSSDTDLQPHVWQLIDWLPTASAALTASANVRLCHFNHVTPGRPASLNQSYGECSEDQVFHNSR